MIHQTAGLHSPARIKRHGVSINVANDTIPVDYKGGAVRNIEFLIQHAVLFANVPLEVA